MTEKIRIDVDKDGWTKGLQLSIGDDSGGYRLAGPKFNGSSKPVLRAELDERDAREIRAYLAKGFPLTEDETRRAALQEAVSAVVAKEFSPDVDPAEKAGLHAALVLLSNLRDGKPSA